MPSQMFFTTVALGTTNANIMAGSQFEFPGRPSRIQVYSARDPITAGVGNIEVFFGQELELAESPLGAVAAAGLPPAVPDNLVVDDIAAPGDRIVIRLSETGGAVAMSVRTLVVLTPIA